MNLFPPDLDIFCHVIDNFGDAGVVYRLATEYQTSFPRSQIRIFTDDLTAFQAVCSQIDTSCRQQQQQGINYLHYDALTADFISGLQIPALIIEAFACEIPELYLQKAAVEGSLLINLDYLMAEEWVEGFHGVESLLGYPRLRKFFFMPGFTPKTGGLLPESHLDEIRPKLPEQRNILLSKLLDRYGWDENPEESLIGTLFSYEHNFTNLFDALIELDRPVFLLVFGSKSQNSWSDLFNKKKLSADQEGLYRIQKLTVAFSAFLPQQDYDLLINLADFNLVRGEDSLARAARSGVPFIWHCYLEKERYHNVKVAAFNSLYGSYFTDPVLQAAVSELFSSYNDRAADSFTEISSESFREFFNNLPCIAKINSRFADFLRNNCNLMEKLLSFVRCFQEHSC